MASVSVLLLAGYRSGPDPICSAYKTRYKALTPVNGQPMILHPVNTLSQCKCISEIIVLAQDPEFLKREMNEYSINKKIQFEKSVGGIAKSVLNTIKNRDLNLPLMITTADNCLLRCEHIEDFLSQAFDYPSDMAIGYIHKNKVISHYPDTWRSWIHFRDTDLADCNLYLLMGEKSKKAIGFWEKCDSNPEKLLRMTWGLGPAFFRQFGHSRLTVNESFYKISNCIGAIVNPIFLNNPDVAIGVNRIDDIQRIESIMYQRR